ncbi:MAG: histidinol dehydrogenase [Aestuariivita sp.]|nr:histidinol dehydrogenase [Aestuariivita sp.]MCY4201946.1 histidinol dehydrogenase [Aestuariivita sp.]
MATFLDAESADFEENFTLLMRRSRRNFHDVDDTVAKIIAAVETRGDAALIDLTRQFDEFEITAETIRVSESEIEEAAATVSDSTRNSLATAAQRIKDYHQKQVPEDQKWYDDSGAMLGWRWTPLASAGLYVPGGSAAYPSSVLMNSIPAKVAGVERLVMVVPTPKGVINPTVMAAAKIVGIDEVYRVGGAQAIAALAFGTDIIRPIDKIVGPGNAFVAAAKRQVFGRVGIDLIAGPSEILVIADHENNPEWIALDLLSQAEHDESAQAILITDSKEFGQAVSRAIDRNLPTLSRGKMARTSWEDFGAIIFVQNLEAATELSNRIAPEHLQLCVANPEELATRCRNAGAIFLDRWTPEAIGDYIAGSNHVLPTAGSARFSSGLSVLDFLKRTSVVRVSQESIQALGPIAMRLANAEGLEAHELSVGARVQELRRRN